MIFSRAVPLGVLLVLAGVPGAVQAFSPYDWTDRSDLAALNRKLCGRVIDHTDNHGCDRRIWSPALCQRRDLYVYVPPGYDPSKRYPFVLWLHGLIHDETMLTKDVVEVFDTAIREGRFPPAIMACPDGSLGGRPGTPHSWFVNSPKGGRFEDFTMTDVWNFMMANYSIAPERDAHSIFGVSSGGGAAFMHGIRYKERFRYVVGFLPMANVRWVDCHGRYRGDFDPNCWGFRETLRPRELVGIYQHYLPVKIRRTVDPIYPRAHAIEGMSLNNPADMILRGELQPGELQMWAGYGGRDELNTDAMVQSFGFYARSKGIEVSLEVDPNGMHSRKTVSALLPQFFDWFARKQFEDRKNKITGIAPRSSP